MIPDVAIQCVCVRMCNINGTAGLLGQAMAKLMEYNCPEENNAVLTHKCTTIDKLL